MTTLEQISGKGAIPALLLAVHGGREAEVKNLLAAGSDVNLADSDGITPLMAAAMGGNLAIARLLLDAGADPRVGNKWGMTAYALAVWHGYSALAAGIAVSLSGKNDGVAGWVSEEEKKV